MYEFAYVHRSPEHIEIVNITKNPLDLDRYTYLEVRRPESPNIKIFCLKEDQSVVEKFYTSDSY
jgi:hypothetical protein